MGDWVISCGEAVIPAGVYILGAIAIYFTSNNSADRKLGEFLRIGPELCKIAMVVVILAFARDFKESAFSKTIVGTSKHPPLYCMLLVVLAFLMFLASSYLLNKTPEKRPRCRLVNKKKARSTTNPEFIKWLLAGIAAQMVGVGAWFAIVYFAIWEQIP